MYMLMNNNGAFVTSFTPSVFSFLPRVFHPSYWIRSGNERPLINIDSKRLRDREEGNFMKKAKTSEMSRCKVYYF